MFQPNQPSSGVQIIVIKESALATTQEKQNSIRKGSRFLLRQLRKKSKTALEWAADSLIITTSTPDNGQLGRNM
jgi:hypothetical protein